jgi:hypothetical protein
MDCLFYIDGDFIISDLENEYAGSTGEKSSFFICIPVNSQCPLVSGILRAQVPSCRVN